MDVLFEMFLGIELSDALDSEGLSGDAFFLLNSLVVVLGEVEELFDGGLIVLRVCRIIRDGEAFGPLLLVQVGQHLLLELILAIVDSKRVVVAVETMNERLDGGLVQVSNVRSRLTRLLTNQQQVRVDQAESINHNLTLNGLDGVNDHSHRSGGQLLERLLSVHIDRRQPAAKTRVRVIPSYNSFGTVKQVNERLVFL